jgi:hypothetical protein
MLCFPIIGLITTICIYIYMRIIYRRVISTVDTNNHMEFKDLESFNQKYALNNFLNYPVYIDNASKNPKSSADLGMSFTK